MTYFGTSAPFLLACRKAGLVPRELADLSRLRGVGSTGAPLPPEGFRWVYEAVSDDRAAAVDLRRHRRVHRLRRRRRRCCRCCAGEISCRCLGAEVEAFDPAGNPVVGELGELVITAPMPSHAGRLLERPRRRALPRGVLRRLPRRVAARRLDHDHRARLVRDHRPLRRHAQPGRRAAGHQRVLLGRRGAATRWSTRSSCTSRTPRAAPGELLLFVVLADGLAARRRAAGPDRPASCAPRCRRGTCPDEIYQVRAVPRTLSAKKLEVPVKRILTGTPVGRGRRQGRAGQPGVAGRLRGARPASARVTAPS